TKTLSTGNRHREFGHRRQAADKFGKIAALYLRLQIGDRIFDDEPGIHQIGARPRIADLIPGKPGNGEWPEGADIEIAQTLAEKNRRGRSPGGAGADARCTCAARLAVEAEGQQEFVRLIDD